MGVRGVGGCEWGQAPWLEGRRSIRASTRARAALSRERSESRSWVRAATCSASSAFVRCSSSWRTSRRSTRSAMWSREVWEVIDAEIVGRANEVSAFRGSIRGNQIAGDRKSTRLNSSHSQISYAVFCLKKKKKNNTDYDVGYKVLRELDLYLIELQLLVLDPFREPLLSHRPENTVFIHRPDTEFVCVRG